MKVNGLFFLLFYKTSFNCTKQDFRMHLGLYWDNFDMHDLRDFLETDMAKWNLHSFWASTNYKNTCYNIRRRYYWSMHVETDTKLKQ